MSRRGEGTACVCARLPPSLWESLLEEAWGGGNMQKPRFRATAVLGQRGSPPPGMSPGILVVAEAACGLQGDGVTPGRHVRQSWAPGPLRPLVTRARTASSGREPVLGGQPTPTSRGSYCLSFLHKGQGLELLRLRVDGVQRSSSS